MIEVDRRMERSDQRQEGYEVSGDEVALVIIPKVGELNARVLVGKLLSERMDLPVQLFKFRSDGFRSLAEGEPGEVLIDFDNEGKSKAADVNGIRSGGGGDEGSGGGGGGYGGGGGFGNGGDGGYGGGGGGSGGRGGWRVWVVKGLSWKESTDLVAVASLQSESNIVPVNVSQLGAKKPGNRRR